MNWGPEAAQVIEYVALSNAILFNPETSFIFLKKIKEIKGIS